MWVTALAKTKRSHWRNPNFEPSSHLWNPSTFRFTPLCGLWRRLFRLYCRTNTGSNRLLTAGRQQQLPRGSQGDEKKHSNSAEPSRAEPSQNCAESRGKKLCYVVSFSHAEWHLILRLPLLTADWLLSFLKPDICWIFQTETVIKFNTWGLINLWLPSGYYFLRHAATLNMKSVSFFTHSQYQLIRAALFCSL